MQLVALLAAVSRALATRAPLQAQLDGAARAMVEHLGLGLAQVWLHQPDDAVLTLGASAGDTSLSSRAPGTGRVSVSDPDSDPELGVVVTEGRSVVDVERGFAACPLVLDKDVVGVLAVASARPPLAADTLESVEALRGILALAIDRARSLDAQLRLAALVEESVDFTAFCTLDVEPLYVNHAGLELAGVASLAALRALGAPPRISQLFHDDDRGAFERGVAAARSGQRWDGELHMTRADTGARVPVWVSLFTLRDRVSGAATALAIIARDLRRQESDAAALRDLAADLEKRVVERTEELQKSNTELEAFSYSVSHDLRAPIRHINGFADMLERHYKDQLDARGAHYLQTISVAARQAGTLIDDLLAFSKVSRTEMIVTDVDLDLMVSACRREVVAENNGRQVEWRIGPLPHVHGDPAMLRVVVKNLLSNAMKYTRKQRAPMIEVSGAVEGERVRLTVRDNGVGFDMHHADKLFGVFQRLHRADEFEGTGIGLANVKRIVERHGGSVRAEGVVDAGATFTVVLPRDMPKDMPRDPTSNQKSDQTREAT